MTRDLGQAAREDLARLQAALRALWPDRPVVYFTEAAGQSLGPGPVLTEEEQQQLRRVAETIRDAEESGRDRGVRPFRELFSGGPDTPCRTTWREESGAAPELEVPATECVEVPLDEVRSAFAEAGEPE